MRGLTRAAADLGLRVLDGASVTLSSEKRVGRPIAKAAAQRIERSASPLGGDRSTNGVSGCGRPPTPPFALELLTQLPLRAAHGPTMCGHSGF
jgi:hypothetical protein